MQSDFASTRRNNTIWRKGKKCKFRDCLELPIGYRYAKANTKYEIGGPPVANQSSLQRSMQRKPTASYANSKNKYLRARFSKDTYDVKITSFGACSRGSLKHYTQPVRQQPTGTVLSASVLTPTCSNLAKKYSFQNAPKTVSCNIDTGSLQQLMLGTITIPDVKTHLAARHTANAWKLDMDRPLLLAARSLQLATILVSDRIISTHKLGVLEKEKMRTQL